MIYRAAGALREDASKGSQGPLNHVFSKTEASNLFSVQDKASTSSDRSP